MHLREYDLLLAVRDYFQVGKLVVKGNSVSYNVNTIEELSVIIQFISLYPLLTFKHNMYLIFCIIFNLVSTQAHLTLDGLKLIIAYINLLNKPIDANRMAEIESKLGEMPKINLPPVVINY